MESPATPVGRARSPLTCLGGYLSAGGAGAVNHYYDRDIDARMERTADAARARRAHLAARRAVLRHRPRRRVVRAADADASTCWPRPRARRLPRLHARLHGLAQAPTPQNIVIGGAAGAIPPLVGWAAATGGLDGTALYLFAIVFFWTPPHFWALSLLMKDEYASVGVPMLPVVRGETRDAPPDPALHRPALRGDPAAVLRRRLGRDLPRLLARARRSPSSAAPCASYRRADRRSALRLYLFSLLYLALLFGAMVARRQALGSPARHGPQARPQEHPLGAHRHRRSASSCSASRSWPRPSTTTR